MRITRTGDIYAAINEWSLEIDLEDGGTITVCDQHLLSGGTITVKRGNVSVEFCENSYRTVVVDCDNEYDVRVRNAMELRVEHGNVNSVRGTPMVTVRNGHVNILGDNTRILNIKRGTAIFGGHIETLTAGAYAHVLGGTVDYLEMKDNAWVYAKDVLTAWLQGISFAYLRTVANGHVTESATVKVSYAGSIETTDHAGAHVGGRTYARAKGSSEVVATEDCVVRRSSPDARVRCYDDALAIDDTGDKPVEVVGHAGGDDTRELSKRAYKATTDVGYSGVRYNKPTKWEVGTIVTASDWEPTAECGHGLHVSRLPGDTLDYLGGEDLERRPRIFEVQIPDGDDRIRINYDKDKVPSAYVVREVDVVGRPLHD